MTISSVGSASLLQQLLQAKSAAPVQTFAGESASNGSVGQNLPAGGGKGPPPPMQGWSSSGQGFSADTLASLLTTQQAEQADRAVSMFADADADGDGAVTGEELTAAMAAHAPPDLPADAPGASGRAANLLANGDADGDGALSLDEFQALKPPGGPGGPPPGPPPGEAAAASTDAADLNGDGVVSADELAQTLTAALDNLGAEVSTEASDLLQKLLSQLTANLAGSTGSTEATAASVDVAA